MYQSSLIDRLLFDLDNGYFILLDEQFQVSEELNTAIQTLEQHVAALWAACFPLDAFPRFSVSYIFCLLVFSPCRRFTPSPSHF